MLTACSSVSEPLQAQNAKSVQASSPRPWVPAIGETWQWQLSGVLNASHPAAVYDVDLFNTPQDTIHALQARGKRVVCYFSAGSAEAWRPDFTQFSPHDIGAPLAGWPGENWLDTRSANVRRIMAQRLDLAQKKGCDGVEPDNVDAYTHRTGFKLTSATQLAFNRYLADQAHARGLRVGLKNDLHHVVQLAPYFDFAVNEQCFEYDECEVYSAFISLGKPVYNAEYARRYQENIRGARDALCQAARQAQIQTLVLSVELDDSAHYACHDY